MELVDGKTLQALLQERGRLPLGETIALMAQAAAALDHAHASQVVHRDVKPANIMIEPGGHVKVMDFGIAKLETGANLTATGSIMGTPNYMSPEQAKGMQGGRALRPLLARLRALRVPDRREAVPGRERLGDPGEDTHGGAARRWTSRPPACRWRSEAVLKRALAKDPARATPPARC